MAMMMQGNGSGGRRGRRRRALNSEINVTPFVDVMLVLLIVFMITAPLLATGIDVTLPNAKAKPLPQGQSDALALTIKSDGTLFLQEEEITMAELEPKLRAIVNAGYDERIYVRGDTVIPLGVVADVFARIQAAGFNNAAIVTDSNAK